MKPASWVLLSCCLAAGAARAQTPPAEGGKLILDESAYFRYTVQFALDRIDPELLKTRGEEILGKPRLERLEKQAKRWFAPPFAPAGEGPDWSNTDWRDRALFHFYIWQITNTDRAAYHAHTPAPPEGWTGEDFDDAGWPRQRLPVTVGNIYRPPIMHGDNETRLLGVRLAAYRTRFEVTDPAGGDYRLTLTYRGGARVLVNGREIARGHLRFDKLTALSEEVSNRDGSRLEPRAEGPAGAVRPETRGLVYPMEAYLRLPDEAPSKDRDKAMKKVGLDFCQDLPGRFDDAFADPRRRRANGQWWTDGGGWPNGGWTRINRKGFDRVTRLRNRVLGPVRIPPGVLKRGSNVLVVEIRSSNLHPVIMGGKGPPWGGGLTMQAQLFWAHCRLLHLQLRCTDERAPSPLSRPAGMQVWTEDVHRRACTADFGPPGPTRGTVRFVGAPNGCYCAKLMTGADRELTGLTVTTTALRRTDGDGEIPPGALRVCAMRAHPVAEMVKLGQGRSFPENRRDPLCPPAEIALLRHGPPAARARRLPREQRLEAVGRLGFFDHIAAAMPKTVPAGTCQAVWLYLTVPESAAAGAYRGSVRIAADGFRPVTVPVEARVIGWRVPDPPDFQTVVALEQSPYGVARQYRVPLWSEEHFRLLEPSFRHLGRAGNTWLFVPVIRHMEFGNMDDSVVKWVRRPDGGLSFDFALLDRYLDLAVKHWHRPRVICFAVMHGAGAGVRPGVNVLDPTTGQPRALDLSSNSPDYHRHWEAFVTSLLEHMTGRGLGECVYWGYAWDGVGDPLLIPPLRQFAPKVRWARGSHGGQPEDPFAAHASVYGRHLSEDSQKGWKNTVINLLSPRSGSTVLGSNGHSPPYTFRLMPLRALAAGHNGVGRLGADYWAETFFMGFGARGWNPVGMGCVQMLWPGPHGAEPGQRFEAFREGIQETEARIFLEQALETGALPEKLAREARGALFEHHRGSLYIPAGNIGIQVHEYCPGWQQRSEMLYRAAAQVAGRFGLTAARQGISIDVPARGRGTATLSLRAWTPEPRAWKVHADRSWIRPGRTQGVAKGRADLAVVVDAGGLAPGTQAKGTLTVTDVESGNEFRVPIAANVSPVMQFVGEFLSLHVGWDRVFNLAPGQTGTRTYLLRNCSARELSWRAASSAEWMKVAPASGKLAPHQRVAVRIQAAPPDSGAARHESAVTIAAEPAQPGGAEPVREVVKFLTFVIPTYRPPAGLPAGQAVDAGKLADRVKTRRRPFYGQAREYWGQCRAAVAAEAFGPSWWVNSGTRIVYDLGGSGVAGFSARVGLNPHNRGLARGQPALGFMKMNFEIWVDGKVVAQSGMMSVGDAARLLVADNLAGAGELALVSRANTLKGSRLLGHWAEPRFHKE